MSRFVFEYPVNERASVNHNLLAANADLFAHLEAAGLSAASKPKFRVNHGARRIEMSLDVDRTGAHEVCVSELPVPEFHKVVCPSCSALLVGGAL